VKDTISRYNEVAQTMTPPRPTLTWEVVEYVFLTDFDLLHEGREDIYGELWVEPARRAAMDQHYRLLRVEEEIQCLNLEVCRLVTYMGGRARFLAVEEGHLQEEGVEGLALQVQLLRMEHARFIEAAMTSKKSTGKHTLNTLFNVLSHC
jgi:hypothetical protein